MSTARLECEAEDPFGIGDMQVQPITSTMQRQPEAPRFAVALPMTTPIGASHLTSL